jgi:AcrR family transcriptional regulator
MEMTATRRRGEILDRAILQASWDELVEKGYAALTFESVADRARTGKHAVYRRWPTKEALLLAVFAQRGITAPRGTLDTGSLRGDVIAALRSANAVGDDVAAVFSTMIGAYFDETKTTPAELRAMALGDRPTAMYEIIQRAQARGELPFTQIPPRIVALPIDLFRHELVMTLRPVPEDTIVDIVDTVFLPLLHTTVGDV